MPETMFRLRWPDETETLNYSPSSIITRFFEAGRTYRVKEFVGQARQALDAASARVQELYGYRCARAAATLATIEQRSANFAASDGVTVLGFGA